LGQKKDEFFPYYASCYIKEGKLYIYLGLLQKLLPNRHIHLNGEASIVGILGGGSCNSYFILVTNLPELLGYVSLAKRRQKGRVTILGKQWHKEETIYCDNCLN